MKIPTNHRIASEQHSWIKIGKGLHQCTRCRIIRNARSQRDRYFYYPETSSTILKENPKCK